jgi:hypothetical protein
VRRAAGKAHPPGKQIPDDGSSKSGDNEIVIDNGRIDDSCPNGLCDLYTDKKAGNAVEEGCHYDRMVRFQDASRNNGSNGVGGVVEAIDEIKGQSDQYNEDNKDQRTFHFVSPSMSGITGLSRAIFEFFSGRKYRGFRFGGQTYICLKSFNNLNLTKL